MDPRVCLKLLPTETNEYNISRMSTSSSVTREEKINLPILGSVLASRTPFPRGLLPHLSSALSVLGSPSRPHDYNVTLLCWGFGQYFILSLPQIS